MVSIKDIAALTGYSVATVSRVINQSPKVSEETRRRVEEVIRSTDYHPNFIGRNLRSSASMKILMLLPTLDNTFFSDVLRGAGDAAMAAGYQIVVGVTNKKAEVEESYISMLRSCQVDGMVLTNTILDKFDLNRLAGSYPVSLLSDIVEGADLSCVTIDNVAAAKEATEHLISLGHRRISMVNGYYYRSLSIDRENGYRMALEQAGLTYDPTQIVRADYNFKGGYSAAKKLMTRKDPPSAIFCSADSMAIGAVRYLMDHGLDKQVSVMGFDNVQESEYFFNGISTVNQPKYELGQQSVQLLLEKIQDIHAPNRRLILPHELVIRGSSHPCLGG